MLRVIVADDEPLVRSDIRGLLADEPGVEVIAEARNGREALTLIEKHAPDIVLLDVQMPELSGFDVLEVLDPDRRPVIVFITAFDQYAVRAFDEHAVDYLLKPFDRERFLLALSRVRERLRSAEVGVAERDPAALARLLSTGSSRLRRFAVRTRNRIRYVPVEQVDWIQAADNYVRIHVEGSRHLVRTTMKQLEEALDPGQFARLHRSAIVNLSRVHELKPLPNGEYTVFLTTGDRLTLSRGYRDAFLRCMESSP